MEEHIFTDKLHEPTVHDIQNALGEVSTLAGTLLDISAAYSKVWTYTKSSGWMLKVCDRKKALFYLIPFENAFAVSMAVRESERETFLQDAELEKINDLLLSAKKFSEGYAIRFHIANAGEFGIVKLFIQKLIKIRN